MTPKVLINADFDRIITEAHAQTQTGVELINKYEVYLMTNPVSCGVVNSFVREASQHAYDNGVNEALQEISTYITNHKASWALASACESILSNGSNHNMLNRNAAHQVEKLLEQDETQVVKYIRAGALKNVMFCEAFRNIAKSIYSERPIIEHKAEYTKVTPCSMVESVGDGYCFMVAGSLYKMDDAQHIQEADWSEVSNTFKTISALLGSNMTTVDESKVNIELNGSKYTVESADKVVRTMGSDERTFTTEQFREYSRLQVLATNPRFRNEVARIMESIALLAENYDSVATLDNANIYTTASDQFVVIESGSDLYATLLASNHQAKWTINEDAIKALSFIKSKTNTELGEEYKTVVESAIEKETAEHKAEITQQLKENETQSIKDRICALTEKFAHDPAKLAVLAKLAAESQEI